MVIGVCMYHCCVCMTKKRHVVVHIDKSSQKLKRKMKNRLISISGEFVREGGLRERERGRKKKKNKQFNNKCRSHSRKT